MKVRGMQVLKSKPRPRIRQICWLLAAVVLLTGCGENTAATVPTPITDLPATAATTISNLTSPTAASGNPTTGTQSTGTTTTPVSPTAAPGTPTPGQASLPTAAATITKSDGEKLLMTIELARTPQEQETGLMGRQNVPDETGMLFIFKQPGQVGFWMKDTPLALSIAFIDQNGKILDIQDMESFSLEVHSPGRNYLYALEVAKGYFARKGVKPGDSFSFKEQ
jgi:uncharacterized membrane protein (UPF0127 family)